jgi:hypothetical protein
MEKDENSIIYKSIIKMERKKEKACWLHNHLKAIIDVAAQLGGKIHEVRSVYERLINDYTLIREMLLDYDTSLALTYPESLETAIGKELV